MGHMDKATRGQTTRRQPRLLAFPVIDFSFFLIVGAGEILRWQLLFEKKVFSVCVAERQSVERDRFYPGNRSQSRQL